MSGFFGIVRADGQEIGAELLQSVAQTLRMRGSTGEAIWTRGSVGTCFSYLEKGLSQKAAQPVWLGDNWLLGDIRLDGRAELIRQLAGHRERVPNDASDEEILLRSWQVWGEASLQRVLGDFSFALYDAKKRALYCVRDFIGARPFYYASTRGRICFSNTLAALRRVPEVSRELDEAFVADFLLRGYCTEPARTVYSGIRRLPAGHVLKFGGQAPEVEVRPFLRLAVEEPLRFSQPREYVEAYHEVLREAVRDRLPGGPAALYLSGGLDSGSVCAIAAQLAAQRGETNQLKAFTVSWSPLFEDPEPHFATLSAERLGLRQEILEERTFQPFAALENREYAAAEPSINAFFLRAQRQYRTITAHSNIIFSGDGGDDVLTGQSWPYLRKLWSAGDWAEIGRTFGSYMWEHGTVPPLRMGMRAKLRGWLPKNKAGAKAPEWLDEEFTKRNHLQEKRYGGSRDSRLTSEHPVHPQAYAALHGGFWASVLEDEDAGCTHVPLESRAPLLDLRVLRYLLRLPPVPWCVNKELARRAMQDVLPEAVRLRPKTPMKVDPIEACMRSGRWSPMVPDAVPLAIRSYLNWEKWCATLQDKRGFYSGSNLFPLALVLWLKDIENV